MPVRALPPHLIDELRRAAAAHQAGRLERAEALYLRLLKKAPSLAEPPYLLGSIAFERGRLAYALQLSEDALQAQTDFAPAHLLRGNVLAAMGRHAEAEACWRRTVELSPGEPAAHVNLALRLGELGRADAALAHARHALAINPVLFRAHYAAGLALLQLKSLAEAEASFAAARRLAPDNIEILRAHGRTQCMLGKADDALETLCRALELSPHDAEARRAHAEALLSRGQTAAAESALRALAAEHPDPATWSALGDLLRSTGRFEEAAGAYRRALAMDSGAIDALAGLTLGRSPLSPQEAANLENAAHRCELSAPDRAKLLHALGRHCEHLGALDQAFLHHAAAKRAVRDSVLATGTGFDVDGFARKIDALIEAWSPDQVKRLAAAAPRDARPVFIVGLPRSGSTLVEQIIASHPDAATLGERMEIPAIAAQLVDVANPENLDPNATAALACEHLDMLSRLAGLSRIVVDKQLDNIFRLGLIGALFPDARVVLCQRDLRDLGLSCYLQEFTGAYNEFLDPGDIGHRALHTQRLARHWLANPPLPILRVQYENVIRDLEGQARAMLDFLGLDWNPACIDFHRTARRISTSSDWQVKQPLYDRSVGRWRAFEAHLRPLLEALDGETGYE